MPAKRARCAPLPCAAPSSGCSRCLSYHRCSEVRQGAGVLFCTARLAQHHAAWLAISSPHHAPLPVPVVGVPAAWSPLEPEPGPYVGLLLVAVLIQELARVGVWRFHRQAKLCKVKRAPICAVGHCCVLGSRMCMVPDHIPRVVTPTPALQDDHVGAEPHRARAARRAAQRRRPLLPRPLLRLLPRRRALRLLLPVLAAAQPGLGHDLQPALPPAVLLHSGRAVHAGHERRAHW